MNLLQLLSELLNYARKLLPLMELYAGRRAVPVRDAATQEFQQYAAEMLRDQRRDVMDLKSSFESIQQRLKFLDDQALAAQQQQLTRIADRQRAITIGVVISAAASIAAVILGVVVVVRR